MKRGIWVECESSLSPLASKTSVDLLCRHLESLEVTDVYLQVYRRGLAYFRSTAAPQTSNDTFDPLQAVLEALPRRLRVHAWINCCNFGISPAPQSLQVLGPHGLIHDNYGRSLAAYSAWQNPPDDTDSTVDTPGAWADPSSLELKEHLSLIVGELVTRYPALSGIHLDFIRYPYMLPIRPGASVPWGLDLGLGPALSRFSAETQEVPNLQSSNKADLSSTGHVWPSEHAALRFDAWRRLQVTSLVRAIQTIVRAVSTPKVLSAAVLTWSDRAYLSAFQDWRYWLDEGLVDKAILMSYTADTHHFSQMLRAAIPFQSKTARVAAGIGCYKLRQPAELHAQLREAERLALDEAVLFSYATLLKDKVLVENRNGFPILAKDALDCQ